MRNTVKNRSKKMKYGICIFPTDYSLTPGELAVAMEEREFESLWVAEHTHIPCSRRSPWPGGGDLPQMYYDVYSPMIALAAAAAATKKLKVATGISLIPQHDPFSLAKEVATLDQISGGRFMLGVGGGWNQEEMENHTDVPFKRRWKLMRERIEAMKLMWTEAKAEYHGEFVDFEPVFSSPKPVQKPHPPIHVAGAAPWALRRTVRYGDGWIPLLGRGDDDLETHMTTLRELAAEAGRDADTIEVTIYACPPDPDKLKELRDLGIHRAVFLVFPEKLDRIAPMLDDYAKLASEVA
jgi:probable F420-dependent oxidoreductase